VNWLRRPSGDENPEGVAAVDRIIEHVDHIGRAVEELRSLVDILRRQEPNA